MPSFYRREDVNKPWNDKKEVKSELEESGIRTKKEPPILKKEGGGEISINWTSINRFVQMDCSKSCSFIRLIINR